VLLALFARVHGVKHSSVQPHLETTQRDAYAEARAWVDSNTKLTTTLREYPERLVDGVFALEPVRGLLGRLFSRSRDDEVTIEPSTERAKVTRTRSEDEQRRLAEAKALVDEALREG
jgi:hypothetical protein